MNDDADILLAPAIDDAESDCAPDESDEALILSEHAEAEDCDGQLLTTLVELPVEDDATEAAAPSSTDPEPDDLHVYDVATVIAQGAPLRKPHSDESFLISFGLSLGIHAAVLIGCFVLGLVLYLPPSINPHIAGAEGGLTVAANNGPPPGDLMPPSPAAEATLPVEPFEQFQRSVPEPPPALVDPPEHPPTTEDPQTTPFTPIGLIAPSAEPVFPRRPVPGHPDPQPAPAPAETPAPAASSGAQQANAAIPASAAVAADGEHHAPTPPRPLGGGGAGSDNGFDANGMPVPTYPTESRRRREEGLVELDLEVRPDGTVGQIRVLSDPGYPRLVSAAIAAARTAHFQPGTAGGVPIMTHFTVPYRFILR